MLSVPSPPPLSLASVDFSLEKTPFIVQVSSRRLKQLQQQQRKSSLSSSNLNPPTNNNLQYLLEQRAGGINAIQRLREECHGSSRSHRVVENGTEFRIGQEDEAVNSDDDVNFNANNRMVRRRPHTAAKNRPYSTASTATTASSSSTNTLFLNASSSHSNDYDRPHTGIGGGGQHPTSLSSAGSSRIKSTGIIIRPWTTANAKNRIRRPMTAAAYPPPPPPPLLPSSLHDPPPHSPHHYLHHPKQRLLVPRPSTATTFSSSCTYQDMTLHVSTSNISTRPPSSNFTLVDEVGGSDWSSSRSRTAKRVSAFSATNQIHTTPSGSARRPRTARLRSALRRRPGSSVSYLHVDDDDGERGCHYDDNDYDSDVIEEEVEEEEEVEASYANSFKPIVASNSVQIQSSSSSLLPNPSDNIPTATTTSSNNKIVALAAEPLTSSTSPPTTATASKMKRRKQAGTSYSRPTTASKLKQHTKSSCSNNSENANKIRAAARRYLETHRPTTALPEKFSGLGTLSHHLHGVNNHIDEIEPISKTHEDIDSKIRAQIQKRIQSVGIVLSSSTNNTTSSSSGIVPDAASLVDKYGVLPLMQTRISNSKASSSAMDGGGFVIPPSSDLTWLMVGRHVPTPPHILPSPPSSFHQQQQKRLSVVNISGMSAENELALRSHLLHVPDLPYPSPFNSTTSLLHHGSRLSQGIINSNHHNHHSLQSKYFPEFRKLFRADGCRSPAPSLADEHNIDKGGQDAGGEPGSVLTSDVKVIVKTYGVETKAYLTPLPKSDTTIVSHGGRFSRELVGIRNLMTTVKYPSATVERAISELERICRHYELDRVEVSTMGLRKFILDDNIWNGYISDKIFCQRLAQALIKEPCYSSRKSNAIIKIQSFFRMIPLFTTHKDYKAMKRAANLFKLHWRRKISRRSLSQHVKREHKRHLENARRLEQELRDNWETRYRGQERVILALPSLTTKTYQKWQYGNIKAYQDNQIGRLLELNDPNVVMIFILSIEDQDELVHLKRVTECSFSIQELQDQGRLYFVRPETSNLFPPNSSLSAMLYTCARTIAKIKKFIKDRPAYISPGLVGNFDIKLSSILNIPICCPFEIIPKFYSSAICRREMMVSSNVRSAPGVCISHPDMDELPAILFSLMIENPCISYWVFYIEKEFNCVRKQRGYFPVSKLLRAKLESIKDSGAESLGLFDSSVQNDCLDTIQVMLETNIVFPQRSSFATIRSFWDSFQAKGGIIEAMPYSEDTPNLFELSRAHETVVFMNLSPGGEIAIYGAVDKLKNADNSEWGYLMPQRTISATNVEELCFDIACHYYESGLYGFFEIDTCTWNHNPSDMTDMSLWCTSVIPFMTTRATYYMYSLLATGSIYDFQDGTICFDRCKARRLHLRYLSTTPHTDYAHVYQTSQTEDVYGGKADYENRHIIFSPRIYHQFFSGLELSTRANLCVHQSFTYNDRWRTGMMFPLVETWDDQSASLLCAYSTIHRTIESFLINLLFINQKLNTNESTFSHNFMDIAKSLQLEWNERKIPTAVDWKKSLCKPTPISIKKKTQRYSRSSITIISGRNSAVSVGRRGSSESTSRSLSLDFFEKAPNSVLDNFLQTLVEIPDYTREDIDWNDEKYQEMHKLDDSHYMLHHNTVILLNTSIPSKAPSMRFKSPDDERLEQLMIARIENRDRVPLGLTPEQYIQFMEVRMEELAFKEAMETEKKIRAKALQLMKDQENKKVKSVVLAQLMVKVKQIQKFNEKRRKSTVRKRRNADAFVKLAAMGSASKAAASAAAAHHHRRSTNTAPPPAPSSLVAVEDEFGSTTSASSNRNRGPSLDTVKETNSKEERDSLKRVSAASEGGGAGMLSVQAPNNGTRRSAVGRMAQLFLGAFLDDVPDDNSRTSNETISYAEQQQQQQFYNIEVSGSQDGQRRRPSSATSLAASPPRFTSLRRPSATPQPPAETDQQRNFSYVRGKSSVLGIAMSQKEKEIIVQSAAALSEPVPVPLAIRGSVLSGVRENTSGIRGTVMGGGASGRSASVATGSGGKAGVTVPSFTFSVGNDDEDGSDFNDTPPKLAIDGPVGDDETLETVSQQPRNDFEDVQIASLSVAPRDTVTRSLVNLIFDDEEEIGKTIRSSVAIKGGSITSSGTMLQQEGDRLAGVDSEVDNDNLSDEDAASTNGRRSSIAPKDMFFSFGDYKLADAEPEVRLAGDEYEDDDDVYSNDDSSLGSSNVSSVHSDELESELGLDEKLADKSGKEQLKAQLEIDKMFRVRQSSMDRRGSSVSTNDHLAGCGSVSGTRRKSRLVSPGDHHHQHQRQQEQEDEEVGGRATTRRSVGSRRVSIVGGNIFTGRRASTLGSILQENPESVLQSRRGSVLQSATSSTTAHEESKHQQQHQNHQHHHHKKERKRSLVYDNSIFPSSSSFSFRLSVVKSTIDDTKKIRRESKSAESARSNVISSFGGDMKTESPDLSRINNLLLQLESVKARGKYEEEKDS